MVEAPPRPRTIAVIEDEASIASAVAARLRSEGYRVEVAGDGPAGVELCEKTRPDLVVLDLMLPGLDGLEVCRRIQRQRATPVLMLTARDSETDLVIGLGIGADDYMTKPFSARELVARVGAILRRSDRVDDEAVDLIKVGEVEIDAGSRRVRCNGELVHLTPTEFDLLVYLAARPSRVATREELLEQVWGYDVPSGARTVDSHVRSLRRKLGATVVRTVHGVGYAAQDAGVMRRPAPERPLDQLPTLKLKLSVIILAAVAVTDVVFFVGLKLGLWASLSGAAAGTVALVVVWFLARGITSPLREMAEATDAMARGDFSRRVTASSHDEIGALARSFNLMAAELAETDRLRRDLVANVSHELRTPITALQVVLENLVDGVEPPDPEVLRTMLAQVERLGRLVKQLLDLSRLEAGVVPLDRQPFDLEVLLDQAVRESRLSAPSVTMTVSVEPPDLELEADQERLHQVVANLVENAVRHSPKGGTVAVTACRRADRVAIEVSDDGPGIPDDEVARVFERFYRPDTARSSRDGGAGLGLAIAKWIVDLHGGDIRPERREPHGCRMVVTLPTGPAAQSRTPTRTGGVSASPSRGTPWP